MDRGRRKRCVAARIDRRAGELVEVGRYFFPNPEMVYCEVRAAALVAVRLRPEARGALLAAHRSAEPGHARVLEALGLEPYLDLGLRLGEGTGAALCIGLARAAVGVLTDMATFKSAGVSDRPAAPGGRP